MGLLVSLLCLVPAHAQLPPTPSLASNLLALETGATGNLVINLSAPATVAQTFVVSNPRTDLLQAPSRVVIPIGAASAQVAVKGLAAGSATVRLANNVRVLDATVQVVAGDAVLSGIKPAPPSVAVGGSAAVTIELSAIVRADTPVALLADPASAFNLPAQVVVPAGTQSAQVLVQGQVAGVHVLQATLRGQTLASPLRVTTAEAAVAAIVPDRSDGEVGATVPVTVRLSRSVSTATEVLLSTDAANVIEAPASLTVPAGADRATATVKLKEAGRATFRARLGETSAQAEFDVRAPAGSSVPPSLTVRPGTLSLTVGGGGLVTVEVDAARTYDLLFALSVVQQVPAAGTAAVVSLPASVLVPAGQRQATFTVNGLAAGTARLGIKPANAPVLPAVDVTVAASVPGVVGLNPGPQPIAKGTVGTAVLTISPTAAGPSSVSIASDSPAVVKVPPSVVVASGGTTADVPLSAASEGTATITATLNGRTASAQVLVGPAVAEELRAPGTLALNVGASARIAAELLKTDGQLVADPAGVVWTSSNTAVATVDDRGEVTGVAAGSAAIEGVLGALRVRVAATVTQLPMLGLAPADAQLALGGTQTYTVSSSAPAPAGGLEVRLGTSGIGTAQVPATVVIPAGASRATFEARGTGAGALLIRAEANGRQAATAMLTVTVTSPRLTITNAAPLTGAVGTVLTITGTGFDTTAANNTVRIGSVAIELTSATATTLVTRVPISAVTGVISVTNGLGTATGPTFTVQQSQDALLLATPNSLRLLRGSEAASALSITSTGTQAYGGSLSLSISGLPAGVTASFDPVVLPAERSGVLRLTANGSVAPGAYQATVTGVGHGTAGAITRSVALSITVPDPQVTPSTGVRGRFVTPEGRPIAGVIVRADTGAASSPTVTTDAAGSFELAGLAAGPMTLRFDATPANPLYPIWPYSVTLVANQMILLKDFVIAPPPEAQAFTPINNAAQDQKITDARFPGLEVTLPAGAEIIGWDGVKKTRIAVEKREISELPVVAPPVPTGAAYQLYFGTPMGGVPSKPIPVTLPNDTGAEPGESVNVWFFDGSPLGGTGEWKIAGQAVVSADGKVARMLTGGLTRFCGVCGLACLQAPPKGEDPGIPDSPQAPVPPVTKPPVPEPTCPTGGDPSASPAKGTPSAGNPVNLYSGQQLSSSGGLSCGGLLPVNIARTYNPVDAFNNIGGTEGSVGYGWTNEYDKVFLPGSTKRLILPGNVQRIFTEVTGGGAYTNTNDPSLAGAVARDTGSGWTITFRNGVSWRFRAFAGAPGNIRGQPQFLVEVSDANGRTTTIARNPRGQLLSVGTSERRIVASYGPSTFIETLTDPEGRTERYTYTASKRLETVTDPDGRVTRYTYVRDQDLPQDAVCAAALRADTGERLKTTTYPGLTTPTENFYGSSRRVLRQTTSRGQEFQFTYKVGGACTTHTARPGQVCSGAECPIEDSWANFQAGWRFHGGQVLATTVLQPDGTTDMVRFGSQGQVLEMASSNGARALITRDAANRPTRMTDGTGRVGRSAYDAEGNLVRHVDVLGRVTEYSYDAVWRKLASVTRYDDAGTAQTWQTTYDSKGNVATITDPLGNRTTLGYSTRGQLISVTDPLNQTTRFTYNADGDLAKVTDPSLNDTTLATDRTGRAISNTDALGYSTITQTNGIGQTTEVLDANGGRTLMAYDDGARLKSVTNPRGNAIATYSYDVYGKLTARTDATAKSETYSYDNAGRIERIVDRKGQITRYEYDTAGRVVRIEFPDRTRKFAFDGADRVVRVEEGSSRVDYEYDAVNRLVKEVQTNGAASHEVKYGYDRLDRRVWRQVGITEETRYEWDLANRLTAIRYAGESTLYRWDGAGRLAQKTMPNGVVAEHVYDSANRLLRMTYAQPNGAQIERIEYAYDARGMRTKKYLAMGNVLADMPMTATYDAADRMILANFTETGESCALSYDANGNLSAKDCGAGKITRYKWDSLNRLVSISGPGLVGDYVYDVVGRRVALNLNGIATTYYYDGVQSIAEVVNGEPTRQVSGVALDEAIAAYSAEAARYAISDALGSVVAEADKSGLVVSNSAYSAYGETTVSGASPLIRASYSGREADANGLIFRRARYYDPVLKRFLSEDPVELLGGLNRYAYARSMPTMLIDPTGFDGTEFLAGISKANQGVELGQCLAGCVAGLFDGHAVLPKNFMLSPIGFDQCRFMTGKAKSIVAPPREELQPPQYPDHSGAYSGKDLHYLEAIRDELQRRIQADQSGGKSYLPGQQDRALGEVKAELARRCRGYDSCGW